MIILLEVLWWWFVLGGGTLLFANAMEFIVFVTRPDHYNSIQERIKKIRESKDREKPSLARAFLFWLGIWPLLLPKIIRAFLRNQTLTEYFLIEQEAAEQERLQARKRYEDAKEQAAQAPSRWMVRENPEGRVLVLLRQFAGGEMPTHLLIVPSDPEIKILETRATGTPKYLLPVKAWDNTPPVLVQAMLDCEEDREWAALCHPTMHRARNEILKMKRDDLMEIA